MRMRSNKMYEVTMELVERGWRDPTSEFLCWGETKFQAQTEGGGHDPLTGRGTKTRSETNGRGKVWGLPEGGLRTAINLGSHDIASLDPHPPSHQNL